MNGKDISTLESKTELLFDFYFKPHAHHKLLDETISEGEIPPPFGKKEAQLSNLRVVYEAVGEFSSEAGIGFSQPRLDKETIILESGHQPNFLPHSGLWKKLFLLDFLRKKLNGQGKRATALFGFADYNLCTARLLTQNKLPAFNKLGCESIGFKISGEDRWKRFDYLEKPDESDWEKEIGRIVSHYKKHPIPPDMQLNLAELIETLEECYRRAKNFPDLNAFFISRICNKLLDLDISFFRYSDLQRKGVFLEEWKRVTCNLEDYNSVYNNSIRSLGLDIPLCQSDSLPFWYHCHCGAKVSLLLKEKRAEGRCRICSREHIMGIEELTKNFGDLSPNAVARNIIFSEGIGTDMFISGSGGGLRYGKISDEISIKLGFCLPVTISWKSRDYYTGPVHAAALHELGKICSISEERIGKEDIGKIMKDKKARLTEMIEKAKENGERSSIKKYEGQYINLGTSLMAINAVYRTTPSFMDVFVSQGARQIIQCWENALRGTDGKRIIVKDVVYGSGDNIYKKVEEIGD
ncbi:MAG: hypothetical protein OIN66_05300 [Candidatus Methanoperedens sp.]|nr:hypothetical protein [Candidatus Methanoperedens sp.]